jgi:hypothetical protein
MSKFQPGVGVQTVREPVNHYPVQGLKEFFLIVSVGRCKYKLSEQTIDFLLQATIGGTAVDLDCSKSPIVCLNLLWLLAMWASISIIFDHSCVKNIIFFLIFEVMEVLIGNLSLKSISKKKQLNGLKSEGGNHLRKNHTLILLNPVES